MKFADKVKHIKTMLTTKLTTKLVLNKVYEKASEKTCKGILYTLAKIFSNFQQMSVVIFSVNTVT